MLASLTDRVFAFVSPSHVVLVHTRLGFFRRNILSKKTASVSSSKNEETDVSAIASTLTKLLAGSKVKGGKLDVLLSESLVRMDTLPPLQQPLKFEEHLKRAQLQFQKVYGAVARKWSFCTGNVKFNQPTLIAALDQDLLSQLQKVAKSVGLKLMIVEPVLMRILKLLEKRVTNKPAWLVVTDNVLCNVVKFDQNGLSAISQTPYSEDFSSQALQTLLLRESLRDGEPLKGKSLYSFSPNKLDLPAEVEGAKLQQLRLMVPNAKNQYSESSFLSLIKQA